MKDIAEGMGAIGTGVERGSLIRAGLSPSLAQPYIAEDIRGDIERERDQLSPSEREMISGIMSQSTGEKVAVPPMGRSELQKLAPFLASMSRGISSPEAQLRAAAMFQNAGTNANRLDWQTEFSSLPR